MKHLNLILLFCFSLCLVACAEPPPPAPIVDGWGQRSEASIYRVQPGDTLYSIAWGFGIDYQDLAYYNNLSEPYAVTRGQALRMSPSPNQPAKRPVTVATAAVAPVSQPASKSTLATRSTVTPVVAQSTTTSSTASSKSATKTKPATAYSTAGVSQLGKGTWEWPAKGNVAKGYSTASGGNRGIDIAGKQGEPIVACASGKVVYTGLSMPGYGKLIIVKHSNNDLSAYAYNDTMLVKEGETVKAGQRIATMGKNNDGKPMLHFEVRKNGKPQDPLGYLKSN